MKLESKRIGYGVILGIFISIHFQCAKPSNLGGGPVDETPPLLSKENSTPNQQTQFTKQDITLKFDEYISLKNVYSQVIISPPLSYNPKIQARGKKLTFAFDEREELKEDATYVINFGDAIVDYNAGNKLENYRFAFSTGDYIDSLSVSGQVKDALTREPVGEVLVMLYDNHKDSVVYLEKPFYFARTDDSGRFKIENLRSDTFKVFALKETNLNYTYDNPSEMIGYLDTLIVVNDSTFNNLDIEIFKESEDFARSGVSGKTYGSIGIGYTSPPQNMVVTSNISDQVLQTEIIGDSLKVWYRNAQDTSFQFYVTDNDTYSDTIKVRKYKLSDFRKKRNKLTLRTNNLESGNNLAYFDTLSLTFTYPIGTIDIDSMSLMDTSGSTFGFSPIIDSIHPRNLQIIHDRIADTTYVLNLYPGSVTDIYDISIDSTSLEYQVTKQEDYGSIHFTYDSLDVNLQYVLLLKDGDDIVRQTTIDDEKGKITFNNLVPQQYDCEIIFDVNKNGRWDPGNYQRQTQSEITLRSSIESLRANWELNVVFINGKFKEESINE